MFVKCLVCYFLPRISVLFVEHISGALLASRREPATNTDWWAAALLGNPHPSFADVGGTFAVCHYTRYQIQKDKKEKKNEKCAKTKKKLFLK